MAPCGSWIESYITYPLLTSKTCLQLITVSKKPQQSQHSPCNTEMHLILKSSHVEALKMSWFAATPNNQETHRHGSWLRPRHLGLQQDSSPDSSGYSPKIHKYILKEWHSPVWGHRNKTQVNSCTSLSCWLKRGTKCLLRRLKDKLQCFAQVALTEDHVKCNLMTYHENKSKLNKMYDT